MIRYVLIGIMLLISVLSFGFVDKQLTEQELLASIITAECSICSGQEMALVGSTVLNRRDSKYFPNTIRAVLYQKSQYLGVRSKWFIPTPKTLSIANRLLNGKDRDYEVFYFYKPKSSNQSFVKAMESKIKYIMDYHIFAKY